MKTENVVCENCGKDVPEDNTDRVCAYQVDNGPGIIMDYALYPKCNCCDKCRQECTNAVIDEL